MRIVLEALGDRLVAIAWSNRACHGLGARTPRQLLGNCQPPEVAGLRQGRSLSGVRGLGAFHAIAERSWYRRALLTPGDGPARGTASRDAATVRSRR